MRIKTCAVLLSLAAGPGWAETPLSAIDWLENIPPVKAALPTPSLSQPDEPSAATTATAPSVSVAPLGTAAPRTSGLIPSDVTNLPQDLWLGSNADSIARRIALLPDIELPALQSLLLAMMLTETAPFPKTADTNQVLKARIEYLVSQGALDPALDLMDQSGAAGTGMLAQRWFDASLLAGKSETACRAVALGSYGPKDYPSRIYCLARTGKWDDAALLVRSGSALGLISDYDAQLLTHFLDPETAEETSLSQPPQLPTALQFTILAALGEPVPTGSLPRLFANADLGDHAGWKPELQAAERLARSGALPANRLLGIYSERQPAASGGLWDRVDALQRFEIALRTRSTQAVSKTLPTVWSEMQSAGLGAAFAQLFGAELAKLPLEGQAAALAFDIAMVSPEFKALGSTMQPQTAKQMFYASIATATPYEGTINAPVLNAVKDAFTSDGMANSITRTADQGQLGEAMLMAISRIHDGASGDLESLTVGLASLRALGREDDARRAALQVLILDRN